MKDVLIRHSVEFIKRNAKKIKKEKGVPHHIALDISSKESGYENWKHFLNVGKSRGIQGITSLRPPVPKNKVIGTGKFPRPNAKIPIDVHGEMGKLLREIIGITELRKSVSGPLKTIQSRLDDWVAAEYPSQEELPNSVFFSLYYGDMSIHHLYNIGEDEYSQVKSNFRELKKLLVSNYHDCNPLEKLILGIESSENALDRWYEVSKNREDKSPRLYRARKIKSGTRVMTSWGKEGVLLRHETSRNFVEVFTDKGLGTFADLEVRVSRDQPKDDFHPMRAYLPYGVSIDSLGNQVLFNRDYIPMWKRDLNGNVTAVEPKKGHLKGESEWFFNDGNPPWYNHETFLKCTKILRDWGVENSKPETLKEVLEQIETQKDKEANPQKYFDKTSLSFFDHL